MVFIIKNIALFEAKNLFRSWFFRIFFLISILFTISFNAALFILPLTSRWMFYGLTSNIPYATSIVFSLIQTVLAIFIASDFLKYDNTLDMTKTIYTRSMSNSSYIFGKTLGILLVFFFMSMIIMIIPLCVNYFFVGGKINLSLYLVYPLLINFPAVLFIVGLTFLIMILTRNQAITFLIVLAVFCIVMFFLRDSYNHIFDFTGFTLPLVYSDFTGWPSFNNLLSQRLLYFFLGSGLVLLSVILIRRLSQSVIGNMICLILGILSFVISGVIFFQYTNDIVTRKEFIKNMNAEINHNINLPFVTIKKCSLSVVHNIDKISVESEITAKNMTGKNIENIILSLNPGLKVKQILVNNKKTDFERKYNMINIHFPVKANNDSDVIIKIDYEGNIKDAACYVDINNDIRNKDNRLSLFNAGKKYSYIQDDFVLLNYETNWYPIAGAKNIPDFIGKSKLDFIEFDLKVKSKNGLTVISQGKSKYSEKYQITTFIPETKLPCISLLIGDYDKLSMTQNNIEFSLYYLKNHNFFYKYFNKDSLIKFKEIINETIGDFETKTNLVYPFKKLDIIETPISYFAHSRNMTQVSATVLPEQILLPEKGLSISAVDFKTFKTSITQRMRERNRKIEPDRLQEMLLMNLLRSTLFNSGGGSWSDRMISRMGRDQKSELASALFSFTLPENNFTYSIFPQYYSYINHFYSKEWNLFNIAVENYFIDKMDENRNVWRSFRTGLSEQDKANITLSKYSLDEILKQPELVDDFPDVIKLKTSSIMYLLQSELNTNEFDKYMPDYIKKNRFVDLPVENFFDYYKSITGQDPIRFLRSYLSQKKLPGFKISYVEGYETVEDDYTKYQILAEIKNTEQVTGLIKIDCMTRPASGNSGGGRGGRRGWHRPELEKYAIVRFEPNESKMIGIILNNSPMLVMVNLLSAKNIPSLINYRMRDIEQKQVDLFEGERIISNNIKEDTTDIIVDNESPNFKIETKKQEGFLIKFFNRKTQKEEYENFSTRNPPDFWTLVSGSYFYGKYKLSASYIKSGSGSNKVSWSADIKSKGMYDVYYYVPEIHRHHRRNEQNQIETVKDFYYTVYSDDGKETISVDLSKADAGWKLLGSFYYSKGQTKIELSDKSSGRLVVADAVRWTKK